MPAIGFKKQFASLIESGQKKQTIRKLGKKRIFREGEELSLYVGMRTKECRLLGRYTISEVSHLYFQPSISAYGSADLIVNGVFFDQADRDKFAQADGFLNWRDMVSWFRGTYVDIFSMEFVLVKWEDKCSSVDASESASFAGVN